jgi:2-polyprenyl-3-methyl-5-hydroxy-6-metoxy-1,4-benzoquinol methylase
MHFNRGGMTVDFQGAAMTNGRSIEDQVEYYDSWNVQYRGGRYEDIDFEIKAHADKLLEEIEAAKLPTEEILEIGCGTGWFTEKLSRLGNVTATT